jgi:hypothetical protein
MNERFMNGPEDHLTPPDELARVGEVAAKTDLAIRAFVRERPIAAIACALALGCVVGKILSRF